MRKGKQKPIRMSASDRWAICAFLGIAVLLFALGASGVFGSNVMRYLLQIFLYITLGEAWNLLSGFAGMTSLGQQLYVGLAGYSVAVLTSIYHQSLALGLLCGAAVSLALLVCAGAIALVAFVLRSKLGLGLLAMRDDPVAAATVGVDLPRSRLAVYLIAAVLSAVAGGVFFLNKGTIYPDSGFSVTWTVSVVFVCIVGGTGTILGPVAGSVIYVLLREFLAHYPGWSNIMLGLITVLVILFFPEGIAGGVRKFLDRRRRKPAQEISS